jgi:hypothetical protein
LRVKKRLTLITFLYTLSPMSNQSNYLAHRQQFKNRAYTVIREKEFGLSHYVYDGAPNEWARERGATHTLDCGEGPGKGTRPVRLLKTVAYIGVDEGPGETIVWEKWFIRHETRWND